MSDTDRDLLMWLKDRLVKIYKESPNADFVLRLEAIAITLRNQSTGRLTSKDNFPGGG